MPNMNGRGPQGQGPMTGRRMGRCANKGADSKKPADADANSHNKNTSENLPEEVLALAREDQEQEQEEAKAEVWDGKTVPVAVVKTCKVPLTSFL